jgi:hypothetical protein
MPIVKYKGVEIAVATVADAAKLALELSAGATVSTPTEAALEHPNLPQISPETLTSALKFLKHVRDKPGGSKVEDIQRVLKVETAKGIGPKMTMINYVLEILALPQDTVYVNPKGPEGRIWYPRKNIGEAISMLETVLRRD